MNTRFLVILLRSGPPVATAPQDSFDLPVDYFGQLPQDLRSDLNDAAFNLSNGPVIDEFGQELGETLLNISRAWEQADTSTSTTLVGKLPLLLSSLTGNSKSAFGKRLVSAGRRFQSMGQYGQGELQTLEEGQVKMQSRLEEEEEAKEVYCNLKPEDKLSHVTSVSRDTGGGLIMVGDGINDAPALAAATVGIVLAQRASATAIAVADVLLLQDNISGVPFCIAKSHQTTSLVKQNVALALSSIFLASLTSVLGFLPLWLTVLLHEGGTLLVCLNSIRALNDPTWSWRQNLVDMVDKFKSVIMFRRRHSTRPGTIEAAPL